VLRGRERWRHEGVESDSRLKRSLELGDTEVREPDRSIVGNQDVCWFHVAVRDARFVRKGKSVEQRENNQISEIVPTFKCLAALCTFCDQIVLHQIKDHKKSTSGIFARIPQSHNMRVGEVPEGFNLAPEGFSLDLGKVSIAIKALDRYEFIGHQIASAVDGCHAARLQTFLQSIPVGQDLRWFCRHLPLTWPLG
jgi:hypothetical protein